MISEVFKILIIKIIGELEKEVDGKFWLTEREYEDINYIVVFFRLYCICVCVLFVYFVLMYLDKDVVEEFGLGYCFVLFNKYFLVFFM